MNKLELKKCKLKKNINFSYTALTISTTSFSAPPSFLKATTLQV